MSEKEKRIEYEKYMKKIDNLENKFVLIQLYAGFGNKIFDCIIGMYLKINFGYTIYYVDTTSVHTKLNDPSMSDIYTKLKKEFKFITNNEGDYIKYYLNYNLYVPNINKLSNILKIKIVLTPVSNDKIFKYYTDNGFVIEGLYMVYHPNTVYDGGLSIKKTFGSKRGKGKTRKSNGGKRKTFKKL